MAGRTGESSHPNKGTVVGRFTVIGDRRKDGETRDGRMPCVLSGVA
jgi:hypothetical protein